MIRLLFLALLLATPTAESYAVAAQEPAASSETVAELEEQTEGLLEEVLKSRRQTEELISKYEAADGEERIILRSQIRQIGKRLKDSVDALVSHVTELEAAGLDATTPRAEAISLLDEGEEFLRDDLVRVRELIEVLRAGRRELPAEELLGREQDLNVVYQGLDDLLSNRLDIVDYRETLGLDVSGLREELGDLLTERADELGAETQLALSERDELRSLSRRTTDESERASITDQRSAVRERLHYLTTSLSETVQLMDELDLDTAQYRDLLIRATGNITTDILDPDVAASLLRTVWESTKSWLVSTAPQFAFKLVLFFFILLGFRFLAHIAKTATSRAVARADENVPTLLKNVAVSMSSKVVLVIGVLVALSQIGIEITPLLAGLGVAGVVAGLALQETLSNFASGVMLLFYHPFDVGDVIEAGGVSGTVEKMNIVSTTMLTFDNELLVVPNTKIWGDVIRNRTAKDTRRVDLSFSVSYEDDIEKTRDLLHDIVAAHELVLKEPAPLIRLHNLSDSSVDFIVRPWVLTQDYWTVHWDLIWAVKARFGREGISIPYPQRDVHLRTAAADAPKPVTSERQGSTEGLEDESE